MNNLPLVGALSFLFMMVAFPNAAAYLIKLAMWVLYNSFRILLSITLLAVIATILLGNDWWVKLWH